MSYCSTWIILIVTLLKAVSVAMIYRLSYSLKIQIKTIKQAIDAGVTAYIVDGIDPARLHTILEISIEQYKKHKKLEGDLKEAQTKLADRKDVEKAKVLLMQLHGLPEDTAFQLLRKNAMSHRITIGEMARRLLDAQKLLSNQLKDE